MKFSNQKILYNKTFTGYVVKRFDRGATIYTKIANGTMDKRRCESLHYSK